MVHRSAGESMALNRKGFFFTILVIVMISLFLLTYGIYNEFKQRSSEQRRVETLESFLQSVEQDLERQAYIMGFRALFIIESDISGTGSYNAQVTRSVEEIMMNGTLNTQPQPLMIGATFNEIEGAINEKASKVNAEVSLSSPRITVLQRDPWYVTVQVNTTLLVKDKNDKVQWRINKSVEAEISVENFEDPLYLISTNGLVTHGITKTTYTPFVQGSNVANLSAHASDSYYTENPQAPSFIQRLEGNMSASPYGIESFVNLPELSAAGISVIDKSVIDYVYFSSNNPTSYRIQGMPNWVRIDSAHLTRYGVENLTL